jgi:hypothetical protein
VSSPTLPSPATGLIPSCSFRPPNALELREGGDIVVSLDDEGTNVKLKSQEAMKGPEANGFTFDRVFGMETRQVAVFEYGVKGIVDGACPITRALQAALTSTYRCHQRLQRNRLRVWTDRLGQYVIFIRSMRHAQACLQRPSP